MQKNTSACNLTVNTLMNTARRRLNLRLTWILCAVLFAFSPAVLSQAGRNVTLFAQGAANGPMQNWEITPQQLEAQPKWQPSQSTLPLSIPKASEVAEVWIKKKNPEVNKFAIATIMLAPMGCCTNAVQDRWYFRIEFNPIIGGRQLHGGQFIAVVLFDGTVVEPRIESR